MLFAAQEQERAEGSSDKAWNYFAPYCLNTPILNKALVIVELASSSEKKLIRGAFKDNKTRQSQY